MSYYNYSWKEIRTWSNRYQSYGVLTSQGGTYEHPRTKHITTVGARCMVHDSVYLGDYVVLGDNVLIYRGCAIGFRVQVRSNSMIGKFTTVGAYSWIGHNVCIGEDCVIEEGCTIGSHVTINGSCRILKGTTIPDYTVVPAFTTWGEGDQR